MANEDTLTAMLRAVDMIRGTIVGKIAENEQPMLPDIGPMYDDITIADRIVPLPFDEGKLQMVLDGIDAAILKETRMNAAVTNAAKVLIVLKDLIPRIVGL